MGYRDYAKDYEIEYQDQPGKRRPKMKRIYIGPYYRFSISEKRVRWLRWFYLINLILAASFMMIPMCIDCPFTRTWYIVVPSVAAWIPWLLAAAATWRLWTAHGKVNREHYELMHERMSGASLFLMGLNAISAIGCLTSLSNQTATTPDYLICVGALGAVFCAAALFSRRKELEMTREENPEKSHRNKES